MAFLRTNKRRIDKIRGMLAKCPIPSERVEFESLLFQHEGELPEDQRLATLVCERAGYRRTPSDTGGIAEALAGILLQAKTRMETGVEPQPSVREALFDEAVYGPDVVRRWARLALRFLVCRGGDVTKPDLGQEHGLPEFGTVGMHVLGYPRRLAKAPYEEQGRRLFDRYDGILRRLDLSQDDDFEPIAESIMAFEDRGELPADGVLRDYVLADYEIEMLRAHKAGRDVAQVMALLDQAARATGEEREAAVADVQRFVLHAAKD